jgi:hypothetical protein
MMRKPMAAGAAAAFLLAGAVRAEPVAYTWTGPGDMISALAPRAGNKVIGTSKCAGKEMTIDVTVDGTAVTGSFHGLRGPRHEFEATLDAFGAFKVDVRKIKQKAAASGGPSHAGLDDGLKHVSGVIRPGEATIIVESGCTFKGELAKK